MNSTPRSDVEVLRRKIRRTKIGLLGATLVVIVLPGAVSIYTLHKKTWLSRADQQTIVAAIAPRIKDEVATSVQTKLDSSLELASSKQNAKLSELDTRMANVEATSGVGSAATVNQRAIQRLSDEVGQAIKTSSALKSETDQLSKEIRQIQGSDERAAQTAQQQNRLMAQSVTEINQTVVMIQQNMSDVKGDLKRLKDQQDGQEQELKKLDNRLKVIESQLQAQEGWFRRMWNKVNGRGGTP
jgi:chromosome segregation ATPase